MSVRIFIELRKIAGLPPATWFDLVRAMYELMLARVKLDRARTRFLFQSQPSPMRSQPGAPLSARQEKLVQRVAFAILCMGAQVPWRSDCLVQALAAQRWLACAGISAPIHIGARKTAAFEAHAWLVVGERIVTGGDISTFTPF